MSLSKFEELLESFTKVWDEYAEKQKRSTKGVQQWAPRKTHVLDTPSKKLFFLLFMLKVHPTFDLAGLCFGVHRSQTNRWYHEYLPLLEKALGEKKVLPKRTIHSVKELLSELPDAADLFIDGTERPIQRPKDKEKRKEKYSGKKKRHTEKNLIGTTASGKVVLLGETRPGSHHDMRMLKDSKWLKKISQKVRIWADSGFQGLKTALPKNEINIPFKGVKDGVFGNMKREMNKIMASVRVGVEHTIGHIKRLRCLTDVSRTRKDETRDRIMLVACGLHNLQIKKA